MLCAGNSSTHTGKWSRVSTRGNDGVHPHILIAVHCVFNNNSITEECPCRWAWPIANWACSGGQYHGWWGLFRSIHEPGPVIWASLGELGLEKPLGVLGWASDGRCAGWLCLREFLHKQTPCSSSHDRGRGRKLLESSRKLLESSFSFENVRSSESGGVCERSVLPFHLI